MSLTFGLHNGISAADYHADKLHELPSLSSSLARVILDQSIEHAHLGHPRLGGGKGEETSAMNTGTLVHALMAGELTDIVLSEFSDYKGGAARTWRDKVKASGKIPVLERDLADARPIVAAIKAKAADGITNTPFVESARHEVTAIWNEGTDESPIPCRARYDLLNIDPNGYADLWDWKTTTDISERAIIRTICKYGYHIQAAFYLRGLSKCLPSHAGRTSFTFVFVESSAPYSVRRVCLSAEFLAVGAREVSRALQEWAGVMASGDWRDKRSAETMHAEAPAWMEDEITFE
jgi:hypothetical protein